jgi:hypothetical protein
MTIVMRVWTHYEVTFDTRLAGDWFRNVRPVTAFVTDGPQTEAGGCCCDVSAGYGVVRADGFVDGAGGKKDVERIAGGGGKQRGDLRDRTADAAIRIHPRELVLHRGIRGEFAVMEKGSR